MLPSTTRVSRETRTRVACLLHCRSAGAGPVSSPEFSRAVSTRRICLAAAAGQPASGAGPRRTHRPKIIRYRGSILSTQGRHAPNFPLAGRYTDRVARGAAAVAVMRKLRAEGFAPDLVIGHCGWGETLFVRDVWPDCRILLHAEFFYSRAQDSDVDFDPEFPPPDVELAATGNAHAQLDHIIGLLDADRGSHRPHGRQACSREKLRTNITVLHEGIDTDLICPAPRELRSRSDSAGLVASRRRSRHLRQPRPGAVPRISHLHAGAAAHLGAPAQGAGDHCGRQRACPMGQQRRPARAGGRSSSTRCATGWIPGVSILSGGCRTGRCWGSCRLRRACLSDLSVRAYPGPCSRR